MSDIAFQKLEILTLVCYLACLIGVPVLVYIAVFRYRLPQVLYWLGAPLIVCFLLLVWRSTLGLRVGYEYVRRAGDLSYDGVGGNAAILIAGLPMGLLSTVAVFLLALAGRWVWNLGRSQKPNRKE